jgi:hypothetical protein
MYYYCHCCHDHWHHHHSTKQASRFAQVVMLLSCIWEKHGSGTCQDIDYLDYDIVMRYLLTRQIISGLQILCSIYSLYR